MISDLVMQEQVNECRRLIEDVKKVPGSPANLGALEEVMPKRLTSLNPAYNDGFRHGAIIAAMTATVLLGDSKSSILCLMDPGSLGKTVMSALLGFVDELENKANG